MTHQKNTFYLSRHDAKRLDDIAGVVLSAKEPKEALSDIQNIQDTSNSHAIKLLQHALKDDMPQLMANNSLFGLLANIANKGKQPTIDYLLNYAILDEAKDNLAQISRNNWALLFYFSFISIIYFIIIAIYKVKVLPVFQEYFASMQATLPALTQDVLSGSYFDIVALVSILIILLFGGLLPFLFRDAISNMVKLPSYLTLSPSYLLTVKLYHRLLLLIYTRIYSAAGEENPIELAQTFFPSNHIHDNEISLLKLAHKHNETHIFEAHLYKREQKVIQQLNSRVKVADILTRLVLFILFARMLAIPILAMYLPIFQMGSVIQ